MSVVRLVTNNPTPINRACTACRHYQPDTNTWGWKSLKFLWWGKSEPSANAHAFAICSAFGGYYAKSTRASGDHCNSGAAWEKAE
jgi:hypothetical protein